MTIHAIEQTNNAISFHLIMSNFSESSKKRQLTLHYTIVLHSNLDSAGNRVNQFINCP